MDDFLHDISWVLPLRNAPLTAVLEFFTWIGYPTFIFFFLGTLFWLWDKEAATRLMVVVVLTSLLNAFLKDLWLNPRPDIAFRLDDEVAQSFGMPSGHAQISSVLWLWLAYEVQKKWLWITSIFIVMMICFSRLYLGVHDIEDILVGLALAALTMLLFRYTLTPRFKRFRELDARIHMPLVLMLFTAITIAWPASIQSYQTLAVGGLMLSWLYGRQIEERYIGFELRDTLWGQRFWPIVLAGLVGVISLFALITILGAMMSGLDDVMVGFMTLVFAGLYMMIGVPLLFKALRLAH